MTPDEYKAVLRSEVFSKHFEELLELNLEYADLIERYKQGYTRLFREEPNVPALLERMNFVYNFLYHLTLGENPTVIGLTLDHQTNESVFQLNVKAQAANRFIQEILKAYEGMANG